MRIAAKEISDSLCNIINNCIINGDLPDDWKLAKVTPIYKNKGSKDDCGNYLPVSVSCHIAKIIEKSIQIQLKEYLTKHNFLSRIQSAYLKIILPSHRYIILFQIYLMALIQTVSIYYVFGIS